jgi:antirestriction protein ArdC
MRCRRYSPRNALLLWMQVEKRGMQLTRVAGYRKWLELGRQVRNGEKALGVLASIRRRLTAEEAAERATQGRPAYDCTGKGAKVIEGFKFESVFDISQTDGEPLPETPDVLYLVGDRPAGLWDAIAKQITTAGYTITRDPMSDGSRGYTDFASAMR